MRKWRFQGFNKLLHLCEQVRSQSAHKAAITRDAEEIKSNLRAELQNRVKSTTENAVKDAFRDIRHLQLDLVKREAERWEEQGVASNAVSSYSKMLPIIEQQGEFYQGDFNEVLLNMLRLVKAHDISDSRHVARIFENLKNVPEKYFVTVETIKRMIIQQMEGKAVENTSTELT